MGKREVHGPERLRRATRKRPSHSTVVAYLALFVALGGTGAWAADKITSKEIARNAVRAKHIKAQNVKGADLAPNAISSAKVADDSLTGDDVDEGTLLGLLSEGTVTSGAAPFSSDATVLTVPRLGLEVRALPTDGDPQFEVEVANEGSSSFTLWRGNIGTNVGAGNTIEVQDTSATITFGVAQSGQSTVIVCNLGGGTACLAAPS
jgi:hypothetical protein